MSSAPAGFEPGRGGADAELSVQQGADTIVWLATLPPDGPNGRFFRNREQILC